MPRTDYSSKPKAHRSTRRHPRSLTQLRVRDLRRLAAHRFAFASESALSITLVEALAQHLAMLTGDPRKRIIQLIDREVRWFGIERFDALLEQIKDGLKWQKAADLGWRLRMTEYERNTCKITTIEAAGISREQRAEINREKRRQRAAAKREARGSKPRIQWLAEHAQKPWIAAGISRRTWYRRNRGTGPLPP